MTATVVGRVRVDRIVAQGSSKVGADWLFDFTVDGRSTALPSSLPAGSEVTPRRVLYAASIPTNETRRLKVDIKATERDPKTDDEGSGGGTLLLDPGALTPREFSFPVTVVEKGGSAAGAQVQLTFVLTALVDGGPLCDPCRDPFERSEAERADVLNDIAQLKNAVADQTAYLTASAQCAQATGTLSLGIDVWRTSAGLFRTCVANAGASAATRSALDRYLGQIDTAQALALAQAPVVNTRAGEELQLLAWVYALQLQRREDEVQLERLTADQRAGCRDADTVRAELQAVKDDIAQLDRAIASATADQKKKASDRRKAAVEYGRRLTPRGEALGKLTRLAVRRKLDACLNELLVDDANVVGAANDVKQTFPGFDAASTSDMQRFNTGDNTIAFRITNYSLGLDLYVDCVTGVIPPP